MDLNSDTVQMREEMLHDYSCLWYNSITAAAVQAYFENSLQSSFHFHKCTQEKLFASIIMSLQRKSHKLHNWFLVFKSSWVKEAHSDQNRVTSEPAELGKKFPVAQCITAD